MHRLTSTAVPLPPAPPVEADAYAEGYAAGRLAERAAVVAWLGAVIPRLPVGWARETGMLAGATYIISAGEHLATTTPKE